MKAWKIEPCKCREGVGHVAGCPNRFGEIGNAIAQFIEDDKRLIAAGAVRNDPSTWRPDLIDQFEHTDPLTPGITSV